MHAAVKKTESFSFPAEKRGFSRKSGRKKRKDKKFEFSLMYLIPEFWASRQKNLKDSVSALFQVV
ncbi:MAG TPA: hypothetical protein DE060_16690 [Lentisphaeria bacterium]|nr:hypothetical protein [Lentisphaeria bacterium]HCG50829.1 hypothetical protein [Lentisphaeria bacterium]